MALNTEYGIGFNPFPTPTKHTESFTYPPTFNPINNQNCYDTSKRYLKDYLSNEKKKEQAKLIIKTINTNFENILIIIEKSMDINKHEIRINKIELTSIKEQLAAICNALDDINNNRYQEEKELNKTDENENMINKIAKTMEILLNSQKNQSKLSQHNYNKIKTLEKIINRMDKQDIILEALLKNQKTQQKLIQNYNNKLNSYEKIIKKLENQQNNIINKNKIKKDGNNKQITTMINKMDKIYNQTKKEMKDANNNKKIDMIINKLIKLSPKQTEGMYKSNLVLDDMVTSYNYINHKQIPKINCKKDGKIINKNGTKSNKKNKNNNTNNNMNKETELPSTLEILKDNNNNINIKSKKQINIDLMNGNDDQLMHKKYKEYMKHINKNEKQNYTDWNPADYISKNWQRIKGMNNCQIEKDAREMNKIKRNKKNKSNKKNHKKKQTIPPQHRRPFRQESIYIDECGSDYKYG